MTLAAARELAKKANVDIVEVAPTSVPPVCRLMDYGKFKYEQQKKDQQSKKAQKVTLLREIRLRPKIGIHDFDFHFSHNDNIKFINELSIRVY